MQKKIFSISSVAGMLMLSTAAFAQSNAGVDPACLVKGADGTETVDMAKCPDGMKVGTGAATAPAPDAAAAPEAAPSTTPAPDAAAAPEATPAPAPDAAAAPEATPAPGAASTTTSNTMIVPPESLTGASVISANDFIGKRVYSRAGDDIGEVNDLIMTGNGGVQAVVLGVGGFLGIGEKDVAISMASIDMTKDGETVKLVVDGTKEQLAAAPAYDRASRTYMQ
jgi:sporulation protein YlmC with PRC-barrel domain